MKKKLFLLIFILSIVLFNCKEEKYRSKDINDNAKKTPITKKEDRKDNVGEGFIYNIKEEKLGEFKNKDQFVELLLNRYYNEELKNSIKDEKNPKNKIISIILLDIRRGYDNKKDLENNLNKMMIENRFMLDLYQERTSDLYGLYESFSNGKFKKWNKEAKRLKSKYIDGLPTAQQGKIIKISIYLPENKIIKIGICDSSSFHWYNVYLNEELNKLIGEFNSLEEIKKEIDKKNYMHSLLNEYIHFVNSIIVDVKKVDSRNKASSFMNKYIKKWPVLRNKLKKHNDKYPADKIRIVDIETVNIEGKYSSKLEDKVEKMIAVTKDSDTALITNYFKGPKDELWKKYYIFTDFVLSDKKLEDVKRNIELERMTREEKMKKLSLKEKYNIALQEMISLKTAINAYWNDNSKPPKVKKYEDLDRILAPFYIKVFILKDPWGNHYYYKSDDKNFWLGSSGSDGKFLGFEQKGSYEYLQGNDIVIKNYEILYYPELD